jgi:hypothetical protein
MSHRAINQALVAHYVSGSFGLSTAYENVKFDPANGQPWASVFFLPAQAVATTQGNGGLDLVDGIFQIDLNYPLGEGDGAILAKADVIIAHFKAGTMLTYSGQVVTLKASGRNGGHIINSQYRISISCGFYAHVSRA